MRDLHQGKVHDLRTALVGSHEEVGERISEYADLGIDHLILSGCPHLEEAWRFAEGVVPALARRGLVKGETPTGDQPMGVAFAPSSQDGSLRRRPRPAP